MIHCAGSALCAGAVVLLVSSVPVVAQSERAAFVGTLGRDTTWVSRFIWTGSRMEGDVLSRVPSLAVVHFTLTLKPDGTAARMESTFLQPDGTPRPGRVVGVTQVFDGDTLTRIVRWGDSSTTRTSVHRGPMFPFFIVNWFAQHEPVLRWMRATQRDSLELLMDHVGGLGVFPTSYRISHDTAWIAFQVPGGYGPPIAAHIDREGRILSADARATTAKETATRLADVDFAGLVAAFASRDEPARGLGALSSRDTIRTSIGAASLWLDYGRPVARGRKIFGALVPYGQVWRTGADAATQFRTDRDLLLGNRRVPAGSYTLWMIPSPSGAQLIINTQTGQWGTEHDVARDLVRIGMRHESLSMLVERMTIDIRQSGNGSDEPRGQLIVTWGDVRLSVPIVVR